MSKQPVEARDQHPTILPTAAPADRTEFPAPSGLPPVAGGPPPCTEAVGRASVLLVQPQTARFGPIGMEQLWNRGGATSGKGSGRQKPENRLLRRGSRLGSRRVHVAGCTANPDGSG